MSDEMKGTKNVLAFLKENRWEIERNMSNKADKIADEALPALEKKHKKDIERWHKLYVMAKKYDDLAHEVERKLTNVGIRVDMGYEGVVKVSANHNKIYDMLEQEVKDIKNEALLSGVTPELTARLLALLK